MLAEIRDALIVTTEAVVVIAGILVSVYGWMAVIGP
jgi:hypothetical protein